MSASIKGGADLSAFLAALPANLERNVLRGALKAGADEIAEGARENCRSDQVKAAIGTTSKAEPGVVTAKVQVKGDGAYIAPWLEYGTAEHFISVDPEASGGRTARRVNKLAKNADTDVSPSLVIGGKFVGKMVHHPGAKPYPFMRPAVDERETAAIAAVGKHIAGKMTKAGITTPPAEEPGE